MKNRLSRRVRNLRLFVAFAVLFALLFGACFWAKKDQIRAEFGSFFTHRVWNLLGLRLQVGCFGGNLVESLAFRDVKVASSRVSSQEGADVVFEAEEISFHYRLPDILMRNFAGWFRIIIDKPAIYADVPFRPQMPHDPRWREFYRIFTQVLKGMRRRTQIVIRDGKVVWRDAEGAVSGIEGSLQDQEFNLELALNHVRMMEADFSTQVHLRGHLRTEADGRQSLVGFASTRGSVVNWKPVPYESKLSFVLSEGLLEISDASVLAGFELKGTARYAPKPDVRLSVRTRRYPLEYFNDLLILPKDKELSGTADVRLDLLGSPFAPMIKGEILIKDSRMGQKPIRNMQLNVEGVYPELRLSGSRVVLEDGTTMGFAKESVMVRDLFSGKTYESLIARTDQEEVIWGDWKLFRTDTDESMTIQRDVGEKMNVKYERFEKDESDIKNEQKPDEVEVEYLMSGKDSFKVRLKDDEEFVGLEKKMSF